MRLRNPRGLDPTLTDVVRQALRDERSVELAIGEYGLAIEVDGDRLVDGLAWETFDYPLRRGSFSDKQREIIDEMLRRREKYQNRWRKDRIETENHTAAEGSEIDL